MRWQKKKIQFLYLIAQQSSIQCSADFKHLVGGVWFLVAFWWVFVAFSWLYGSFFSTGNGSQSREKKERKMNRLKKKEEKEGEILYMCCLAGCMFSSLAPVFSGAPLLNVALVPWLAARLKSQYIFFLAPQSQHVKTSSRSAGLLPLSVLHTLSRTMRSDPHTAL